MNIKSAHFLTSTLSSDVVILDNVKIQNNVSIYTGTVVEDDVFPGPSWSGDGSGPLAPRSGEPPTPSGDGSGPLAPRSNEPPTLSCGGSGPLAPRSGERVRVRGLSFMNSKSLHPLTSTLSSDVVILDNVKVQNNVSIYTDTVIEDDVFLGPSWSGDGSGPLAPRSGEPPTPSGDGSGPLAPRSNEPPTLSCGGSGPLAPRSGERVRVRGPSFMNIKSAHLLTSTLSSDVVIGNNVKVQNNVSIYTGTVIEDDVFLGPSCVLTNVTTPRSQVNRHALYERTLLRRGCSVGANATSVCSTTIGRYAFIAADAKAPNDVPDHALMEPTVTPTAPRRSAASAAGPAAES